MEQGATGNTMYIIMEGECGIYVTNTRAELDSDEDEQNQLAVLSKNTVIGEKAVMAEG